MRALPGLIVVIGTVNASAWGAGGASVLVEDFDDNALDDSLWCVHEDEPGVISVAEINQRLEVSSPGNAGTSADAVIYSCGWGLDVMQDFRWRVDFHYVAPGPLAGDVGIDAICWFEAVPEPGGGPEYTGVTASNGRDAIGTYFGTEHFVQGAVVDLDFAPPSPLQNGTVYFSYHAISDILTVSALGYDAPDGAVYVGLRAASGSATAGIALGGYSNATAPAFSGDTAWTDLLVIDAGSIVIFCPQDIDGDGNVGFGDLLILLGAWGPNPGHPADFDDSGAVDFSDLLALLGAWGQCS